MLLFFISQKHVAVVACSSDDVPVWRSSTSSAVAGPYDCNCSQAEADAWLGQSRNPHFCSPALLQPPPDRISLSGKSPQLGTAPVPAATAYKTAAKPSSAAALQPDDAARTGASAAPAAAAAESPAVPLNYMNTISHKHSRLRKSSLGKQQQAAALQLADLAHEQQQQDTTGQPESTSKNRDSLGGTQGAVTGLTHMALQKHNEAVQLAGRGMSLSTGVLPSEDTQMLGMQASIESCIQSWSPCTCHWRAWIVSNHWADMLNRPNVFVESSSSSSRHYTCILFRSEFVAWWTSIF